MFPKVECKNKKIIIEKLFSVMHDDQKENLKNAPLEKIIYYLECCDNVIEILNKINIKYIFYTKYCDGGFSFDSSSFKFGMQRGENDSSYYKQLAKMYTIIDNKSDYDLYVEELV